MAILLNQHLDVSLQEAIFRLLQLLLLILLSTQPAQLEAQHKQQIEMHVVRMQE